MKNIRKIIACTALLISVLPALGATFSYPSEEKPWFTVDIPATWKPALAEDESLEATSPEEDAYLTFWVLKGKKEIVGLEKDIAELLKELVKNPKLLSDKPGKKTVNGIEFTTFGGTGKDTEDGSDLGFEIFLFSPQPGKLGIFYCQYAAKAPKPVIQSLIKVVDSIKLAK
jgi:hypothetical protein